jgi:predicted nucleotidyltransferase
VPSSVQWKQEVDALINRSRDWAASRADVRGLALVGSWARDQADHASDVDLILLVDEPDAYVNDEAWIKELGARWVV